MSKKGIDDLNVLVVVGGITIYISDDGKYVCFLSDLSICNDGSGPAFGDPHHQSQTAYYNGGKFLNAQEDKYVVVPPQVRSLVGPVVMGCQAKLTRLDTMEGCHAVCGEI